LHRIRAFDNNLWRPHTTELPVLLPPETATFEDGFEYTYCGFNIQQKGHLVFQKDLTVNFVSTTADSDQDENEDEDEDEGSDFDPSALPSYDDTSDGGSISDASDESSSSGLHTPNYAPIDRRDWEADPDLALAVFTSIVDS